MDTANPDPAHPVPTTGRGRLRRHRRLVPVAAALLGLTGAAAACSSNPSSPGVAGASSGTSTTAVSNNAPSRTATAQQAADALAYSQCMRSHGVGNFPDPGSNGSIQISSGGANGSSSGLSPNNPTFKAASKACQSKLGPPPTKAQQAQALSNALKVSQCMRNHGIKDFPDPTTSGGHISMSIQGGPGGDLNPSDPLFEAAQKACMPNAPAPPPGDKASGGAGSGGSGSSGIVTGPG